MYTSYVPISVFTIYVLNDEPFIPTCADLICCDGQGCNKAYHATCAGIENINALPEIWYCPSCTIRSRISAKKDQSQSKVPSSAKQEADRTAADTTVSSPDVPISIDVKKDTAYEDDTDDFESCKSSQSSQAQVDHKSSDTKNAKNDEDEAKLAIGINQNQVLVQGCDMPEVNGIYTQVAVTHEHEYAPVYTKRGSFAIYCRLEPPDYHLIRYKWYIGTCSEDVVTSGKVSSSTVTFYTSSRRCGNPTIPPENFWSVCGQGQGISPPPQLVVTVPKKP